MIIGRSRALVEWAGVVPLHNGAVTWIGQFNNQVIMTDIVAYLATDGITTQDIDDAI
jgi:hypothetical protein